MPSNASRAIEIAPLKHRGLILDFGGVVTTDFQEALSTFCIGERLDPNAMKRVLQNDNAAQQALAAAEAGVISQHDFETVLADVLGVRRDGLIERAGAELEPRSEVLKLVERARAARIATAVLSNSWGEGGYDPYAGYDLDQRFDVVVISDKVGLRKPDPAIYLLTTAKMNVPPRQCVFVDDNLSYLLPASDLGMAVVHFRSPRTAINEIEGLLGLDHHR